MSDDFMPVEQFELMYAPLKAKLIGIARPYEMTVEFIKRKGVNGYRYYVKMKYGGNKYQLAKELVKSCFQGTVTTSGGYSEATFLIWAPPAKRTLASMPKAQRLQLKLDTVRDEVFGLIDEKFDLGKSILTEMAMIDIVRMTIDTMQKRGFRL